MLTKAHEWIDKTIKHLNTEFAKLQLGRANPSMIEDMFVEVYGVKGPLKNSASIGLLDNQTLSIKPWDKNITHSIAKAITDSWIGLNPQTMADGIIIKVPPLTEERRKDVSKIAKKLAEEAKISIRNVRGEIVKLIKKAEDEKEISEDLKKDLENDLQKMVDEANKKIDELYKAKDADIMKI